MKQYRDSLHNCSLCKNKWILWTIQVNFRKWNRIIVEGCLTFAGNKKWFQVLPLCWAATNACRLIHGMHLGYRKTFLVIKCSTFGLPRNPSQGIHYGVAHETRRERHNQFHEQQEQGPLSQEMTSKIKAQFQCGCLWEGHWPWVRQYQWKFRRSLSLDSTDSRYRSCNSTNSLRHVHYLLEDKIQESSDYLFWFSIGHDVMDQRSGDGWFIGRIEILAINRR